MMNETLERCDFLNERWRPYDEIWRLQKERVDAIVSGKEREAVFVCEHESLFTLGKRSEALNQHGLTLPVYEIERGGGITWHGPGQLVLYPILRLQGGFFKQGLHEYLRFCEELVIQFLLKFGLEAGRFGPTGVWVKDPKGKAKKIASIGVAVRRWITYHGIALNVCNDMKAFEQIRPCGMSATVMTSLKELGIDLSVEEVASSVLESFLTLLDENQLFFQDVAQPKS